MIVVRTCKKLEVTESAIQEVVIVQGDEPGSEICITIQPEHVAALCAALADRAARILKEREQFPLGRPVRGFGGKGKKKAEAE